MKKAAYSILLLWSLNLIGSPLVDSQHLQKEMDNLRLKLNESELRLFLPSTPTSRIITNLDQKEDINLEEIFPEPKSEGIVDQVTKKSASLKRSRE